MNAKHTPGPWYADGLRFVRQVEAPRHVICRLPHTSGQRDQALIAAAPELLAALEAFLRAPSVGSNGPGSSTIVVQDFNLRAAREAIAKATRSQA